MAKFLSEEGLRYFYNQIKSKFAAASHNHSAANITSGTLPIERGGTGATTAVNVRGSLGLGYTTGALPIANGGTGANNAKQVRQNLGIDDLATNTVDYVIDYQFDSDTWTRKWKKGFTELGGNIVIEANVSEKVITLSIPLYDDKYIVLLTTLHNSSYEQVCVAKVRSITTTNFKIAVSKSPCTLMWYVCGRRPMQDME